MSPLTPLQLGKIVTFLSPVDPKAVRSLRHHSRDSWTVVFRETAMFLPNVGDTILLMAPSLPAVSFYGEAFDLYGMFGEAVIFPYDNLLGTFGTYRRIK